METFSVLLALCEGNPPITGEFPSQGPVTRSFDAFFLICAWTNAWTNNQDDDGYDVTMSLWRHSKDG